MNGPMVRPENAPENWFCNTITAHGVVEYGYDIKGRVYKKEGPCMCSACIRAQEPDLFEGEPIQAHKDWPVELLKEKGYVGLYKERSEM